MSRYICSPRENRVIVQFNEEQSFKGAPFDNCIMPTGERGTVSVAFGFDHAVGLFCQIYKHVSDDKHECLASVDSMFHKLSKSHLLQIIEDFTCEADRAKYHQQLSLMALDLPF